ncbi:acyltransferase family protein [Streptomyces sp. NPDC102282]|uniref:acyltransferase family protein n=1 Tax=Streptomyces sp. NPDC102282 TaxID=3366154 RepID=UPI00381009E2
MRWAAALMVFFFHVKNFRYFDDEGQTYATWAFGPGAVGVTFFFILSGFVLAWSARPGDKVVSFWRRRLARIYPVHVVTTLVALALAFTVVPVLKPKGGYLEVAANFLMVNAWTNDWWHGINPVSWSLVCESFFYLCFPALYAVLRRMGPKALTVLVALCVLTVMVLPAVNRSLDTGMVPYCFPLARFPEFVLGVAVARLVQLDRWRGPGLEGAMAVALVGYFMAPLLSEAYASTTVLGFTLLIAAAAAADVKGLPSMWRGRRMVTLGEWSFAFYMVHVLVLQSMRLVVGDQPKFDPLPALAVTAVAFAVSLAGAALLHHLVELPGRRLLLGRKRTTSRT